MTIDRDKFIKVFEEEMTSEELKQSYQTPSESEQESPAQAFLTKIKNNKWMLYGLIGEYGTGKSSFLNAVRDLDEKNPKTDGEKPNIQITFEAWKYSDRKELRDAFIVEVLAQILTSINKTNNPDTIFQQMDEIKKRMSHWEYTHDDVIKSKRNAIKEKASQYLQLWWNAITSTWSMQEEWSAEKILYSAWGIFTNFLWWVIWSTITESKESVSRLFDYEYFFEQYRTKIIKDHSEEFGKVYIIIEDIDRCDRDGMIFIETLSYFISQVSWLPYMLDKLMCIVSVGNQFLQDNRHLINKAITNYSFFEMKVDSIISYFNINFKKAWLSNENITVLTNFIKYYLETDGTKRTIREIKYLFRKITPLIRKKWEEVDATDEVILGMILFNFSLFIRSNRTKNPNKESFDSIKPLIYLKWIKPVQGLGNEYYSSPANRQIIDYSFLEQPTQASIILENHNNLSIYYKLFGEETRNININSIFCFENNKIIEDSEHKNPDNSEVLKHWFLRDEREVRDQNGGLRPHYIYLFSPYRLLDE